ncbi:hypothetical protein [Ammoniphilus sp. CFH 90114]|uniref:hypothetical protein n=1 Tax=Ammoniphilus sp. CFH 90114 TaxID=2493665 RepID=UPI00100F5A85|nr:hypothetical protein [Ammoniphilus sp. CFH 90114]RXT14967.1 hypothetical protein EIZ39_01795 [Ammoniphilus sp. CFH 90114]
MFKVWYKRAFPQKTFQEHFRLEHEFHGVIQHQISETFRIRPVSLLGLQFLLDGVQISDPLLHLNSKIAIKNDHIKVCFMVIDPSDSRKMLSQLIKTLVKQLLSFEKRFYSNPVVHYVEPFCKRCVHYQTKPLNQCISNCCFQAKDVENSKEDIELFSLISNPRK